MAIKTWSENIHEPQKGEVQREWVYLEPFLYFTLGDYKEYHDLLVYEFKKQFSPSSERPSPIPEYDKFVEEHPITFHRDDIKAGHAPSYDTILQWAKGRNCQADTKYTWIERRTSNNQIITRRTNERLAARYDEIAPYLLESTFKGFKDTEKAVSKSKAEGKYTPAQAEHAAKARSLDTANMRSIAGKDKQNFEGEFRFNGEIQSEVKTELQSDIEKVQKEILSPAFQELTDKLAPIEYHDTESSNSN